MELKAGFGLHFITEPHETTEELSSGRGGRGRGYHNPKIRAFFFVCMDPFCEMSATNYSAVHKRLVIVCSPAGKGNWN